MMLPFYDRFRRGSPISQSMAIPFRRDASGGLEILLITSRRRGRWVLPKGNIKRMLPHASAAKEAFEEAGVLGVVSEIAVNSYQQASPEDALSKQTFIPAFPLFVNTVLQVWPEMNLRERRWYSMKDALSIIKEEGVRLILEQFDKAYRNEA